MYSVPVCRTRDIHWRSIAAEVIVRVWRAAWGSELIRYRPQVNEPALSLETELGAHYRLDESLMERMMLPSTASTLPIASSRLNIQRRMHPEIADIMRATLYPYLEVFYHALLASR